MQVVLAFMSNESDCVRCAVDATLACRLNPLAVTEVRDIDFRGEGRARSH
jgi:hypothetical protein